MSGVHYLKKRFIPKKEVFLVASVIRKTSFDLS